MKKLIGLSIIIALFAIGYANPTMRIGKLPLATKLVVHKAGKDPLTFTTTDRIKSFARLFKLDVDPNRKTAGTPPYRVEFWRNASDKKPFEEIWIDRHGSWGFVKLRPIYGFDKKLVDWIEELFKD
jgi:hypothetical protein